MTHFVYTGEEDVHKPGVYREVYDPACGAGGTLSVSEKTIRAQHLKANFGLYAKEYNDESWAIGCVDMLIKDEEVGNIVLGDTLGDGKTRDGFPGRQFHDLLANPRFGVGWKDQKTVVEKEHEQLGFNGCFSAGLSAINHQRRLAPVPPANDFQDARRARTGRRGVSLSEGEVEPLDITFGVDFSAREISHERTGLMRSLAGERPRGSGSQRRRRPKRAIRRRRQALQAKPE